MKSLHQLRTLRQTYSSARCGLMIGMFTLVLFLAVVQPAVAADVRVGYLPTVSFAPIFIAIDKGYYSDAGVNVNLMRFASGSKMISPLAVGGLEVAAGGWGAGLINAIASGTDIRIVADKGQVRPGYSFMMLQVRKDLIDSGKVKTAKDLKGMKLSVYGFGLAGHYFLAKLFERHGAMWDEGQWVRLSPPKSFQALKNKAVAGSFAVEPWGQRAVDAGFATNFALPEDVPESKVFQVAVIIYGGKFMRERGVDAKNFMKAYVKGIKFLNKRGLKNEEILTLLGKFIKIPPRIIKASIPFYIDNEGKPHLESMRILQDWLHEQKLVKTKVPMSKLVDLQFLKP